MEQYSRKLSTKIVLKEFIIMGVVAISLGILAGILLYVLDPLNAHGLEYKGNGDMKIDNNTKDWIDIAGYLKIIGTVTNNGTDIYSSVEIRAELYNQNNELIGTSSTLADDSLLHPQQTTTFMVLVSPSDVATGSVKDVNNYKLKLMGIKSSMN